MKKSQALFFSQVLFSFFLLLSCQKPAPQQETVVTPTMNELTEDEKLAGWELLFDGSTLNGWKRYNQDTIGPLWTVKDGMIVCDGTGFGEGTVREANLDHICRYADVISFHVPLTDDTSHMANDIFFKSLRQKPFIINTSRGSVVQTSALIDALKQGVIAGAGLDVLENEKLDSFSALQLEEMNYLTKQPNVILTPHIAGYSAEAFYKMSAVILEKLEV